MRRSRSTGDTANAEPTRLISKRPAIALFIVPISFSLSCRKTRKSAVGICPTACRGSRRRKESRISEKEQHEAKERSGARGGQQRKRQRTAALQDAVARERTPLLPQGFGVRLSSAAL